MSTNFFSQPLSTPNQQIGQLETSVPHMLMGPESNSDALQQISSSNEQMRLLEPISCNHGPQKVSMENIHTGQVELQTNDLRPQQFLIPNKGLGGLDTMLNYTGPQQISPNKRKALMESMSSNPVRQRMALPNKRVMQVEHRPWLQQLPSPNMKNVQMQSVSNIPGQQNPQPASRKAVLVDSISKKAGPQQLSIPKNQTSQMQPSPKVQAESFGSVRSKLRESLAAALALVTQQNEKPSGLEKSVSESATSTGKNKEVSQSTGSASMTTEAPNHVLEKPKETFPSCEGFATEKHNDDRSASQETSTSQNAGDSTHTGKFDGQEFQLNPVMPEIDVPFGDNLFVKDELLQGNGLSWAIEVDMEVAEEKEVQNDSKQRLDNEEVGVDAGQKALESPETLAFKIESELFKLFEGVNKKYKEKGRSLLFNLKDRSNPELREKVMSGDIPPERLCSMTAEELASKELSEWRIAKAEELASMVVLPDSDVDMRRLVKKTHKGEVQVEYEQDDSVSVEVSVGASALPHIRPRANKKTYTPSKPDKTKDDASSSHEINSLEDQDAQCTLTIPPNEEADLMLDELKDADFLPPIVSLDEFMESLDSEPPFENLPLDAEKTASPSDKDQLEVVSKLKSSGSSLKVSLDSSSDKPDKKDLKVSTSDAALKSSDSRIHSATPPGGASKGQQVWEGSLQLNPSAVITVIGFFKSGEKTSTKEWPSFLEIKGRVRLDAFEKFIHELPMSRSRAVMVAHFVLKDGSVENDRASLSEVADSYLLEDRVGFAEPSPGVELYICPTHSKTLEMFRKHLPKDHTDALDATTNNGLIGVVVSRKVAPQLTSTISPNSSSHHKHSLKKQQHHTTSRRHQEKDVNMNANFTSKPLVPPPRGAVHANSRSLPDDDDDDVPPGFGPGAAVKEDDDLPEFNFSSGSTPPVNRLSTQFNPRSQNSSQPVHNMRELIHRYGQPGTNTSSRHLQDKASFGVALQPWNDDDDDDIPEWQPQSLQQLKPTTPQPQQQPAHSFQQQMLRPHMVNQQHNLGLSHPHQLQHHQTMPLQSLHPQMTAMQNPHNGAWGPPPFNPHGYPPVQGGQMYGAPGLAVGQPGTDRRRDLPRSRDF